jgi:hypothetical protein
LVEVEARPEVEDRRRPEVEDRRRPEVEDRRPEVEDQACLRQAQMEDSRISLPTRS